MSGKKEKAARKAAGVDLKAQRAAVAEVRAEVRAEEEERRRENYRHHRRRPTIHTMGLIAAAAALADVPGGRR